MQLQRSTVGMDGGDGHAFVFFVNMEAVGDQLRLQSVDLVDELRHARLERIQAARVDVGAVDVDDEARAGYAKAIHLATVRPVDPGKIDVGPGSTSRR